MAKITKRSVDALAPKATDYFEWDSLIPGFGVRVSPKGRKTYTVQYRVGGRTKRVSLGVHGAITPDEARALARQTMGEVARGEDPAGQIERDRRAPTVSSLCDRFLDEYVASRCKATTARDYRAVCKNYIRPKLGMMRVQDVVRTDIADMHHKLRDKPYQANRVLAVISKMFSQAEVWGLRPDGSNPTRHVRKYAERKRERFLSHEEIKTLWNTLDHVVSLGEVTEHVAAAYRLLLLTGCRLSEIQTLKWSYVRGEVIWLPDAKTGPRRVMLAELARKVLSDLPRVEGNPYVIVGEVEGQHAINLQKPWRRIRKEAKLEDVRIHDLRHTYASFAAMAGHSLHMIGNLLGHTQAQTTARYAHLADAVTRRASDDVGALIGGFLADDGSSEDDAIVEFRRGS
ncbi:site-specific integrase [Maricaulis sp.]|uniref:tyrosine-type recombinase/integrase n=1 Tax=Maricaulis sp. TaxID=1486257 RepID=UPI001B10F392|nr:site-specific integrase [Maricaulis sp.]MBO6796956.1 tyrosine-type recombinase/integrase [Maricaulis sp.]